MGKEINKTIVVTYEEACKMMDYTMALCGCCSYENFDQWYEKNEAYFVKKGMYIMEGLMKDENDNRLKYCFAFDFEDPNFTVFTIYNYYTQSKICTFRYTRDKREDGKIVQYDIQMDEYSPMAWQTIGDFMNETIANKTKAEWNKLERQYGKSSLKVYNRERKNTLRKTERMIADFMCEHTVYFTYATMFYFSVQRPDSIKIEEFESTNPKEIELYTRSGKRKYYYSGYVNLSETKIYRAKINNNLEVKKRGEYERHIEKWGVRGHYRTVNGKQIWIEAFEKGKGRLEKRIYGTLPESEMNIIPQVFEIDIKVPTNKPQEAPLVGTTLRTTEEQLELEANKTTIPSQHNTGIAIDINTHIEIPLVPPSTITFTFYPKLSLWTRFKNWIKKIFIIK